LNSSRQQQLQSQVALHIISALASTSESGRALAIICRLTIASPHRSHVPRQSIIAPWQIVGPPVPVNHHGLFSGHPSLALLHKVAEQASLLAIPKAVRPTLWLRVLASASYCLDLTQSRLGDRTTTLCYTFALLRLGAGLSLHQVEEELALDGMARAAECHDLCSVCRKTSKKNWHKDVTNAQCSILNTLGGVGHMQVCASLHLRDLGHSSEVQAQQGDNQSP
jgi:hypothetical protein